jgi:hypothetical protein
MARTAVLFVVGSTILLAAYIIAINSDASPRVALATMVLAVCGSMPIVGTLRQLLTRKDPTKDAEARRATWSALERQLMWKDGHRVARQVKIHVWQVPRWYRTTFPFAFRRELKRHLRKKKPMESISKRLSLRPVFLRVACAGLPDAGPSNVVFKKRVGIVGRCVEKNLPRTVMSLDATTPAYVTALRMTDEEWERLSPEVTNGLRRDDARLLAEQYGKVICEVIRTDAGEAIGCVSFSIGPNDSIDLIGNERFEGELHSLAVNLSASIM